MSFSVRAGTVWLLAFLLAPHLAGAQGLVYSGRTPVQPAAVQGRGGAVSGLSSVSSALFYNPAHLVPASADGVQVLLLSAQATLSVNAPAHARFYEDDLGPALERGIATLPEAEQVALYREAYTLGRERALASGVLTLPSFVARSGPVAFGGGVLVHSMGQYRFAPGPLSVEQAGTRVDVPTARGAARLDLAVFAGGALDLAPFGAEGLALGATVRYTRRFLATKQAPLVEITPDENGYLMRADGVGLDVGTYYALPRPVGPGRLSLGAAVADLPLLSYDYAYRHRIIRNGPTDTTTVRAERAFATDRYGLRPSWRAGVAYTVRTGPVPALRVGLDVVRSRVPDETPSAWSHLHLGVEARVLPRLLVRAGLGRARPALGAGLRLGVLQLDYALAGVEDSVVPRRPTRWQHSARLALLLGP